MIRFLGENNNFLEGDICINKKGKIFSYNNEKFVEIHMDLSDVLNSLSVSLYNKEGKYDDRELSDVLARLSDMAYDLEKKISDLKETIDELECY